MRITIVSSFLSLFLIYFSGHLIVYIVFSSTSSSPSSMFLNAVVLKTGLSLVRVQVHVGKGPRQPHLLFCPQRQAQALTLHEQFYKWLSTANLTWDWEHHELKTIPVVEIKADTNAEAGHWFSIPSLKKNHNLARKVWLFKWYNIQSYLLQKAWKAPTLFRNRVLHYIFRRREN